MPHEELVDIYDQGRLAGILHIPSKCDQPCPLVIYCPGKNGERYEVHRLAVKLARYLSERGIGFLRFDYFGLGLSDGYYHEMTTSTKISNVTEAYKYSLARPEINQEQIIFLGFSDGARIALMTANQLKRKHIILWSPLFYEFGGNYPNKKKPRFARHRVFPKFMVMPWAGLWVSLDFYKDLQSINIEKELGDYNENSLLIFGDDDPLIKEEFNHLKTIKYSIYQSSNKNKVISVAGAGHLFTSKKFEKILINQTYQWLYNNFLKGDE